MILIKDNHIALAGSVAKAIKKVREKASFSKKIEVEVARVDDVLAAAKARVDIIMMDNFSPKQIEKAIKLLRKTGFFGKVLLEASGGIKTENIIEFASTGVDIVSLGEITDSPRTLDISLEITKTRKKTNL
jgi:nicotinate-nucleotide pyrophosphorylase (carboxylating)